MDIRRFAFVRKLQGALRFIACDRHALLNELAQLRERIEIATERFWSTRRELEETAYERDQWRERAAMLERLHDENRAKESGRPQLPKTLPTFGLRQVLVGPVSTLLDGGVYVELDGVEWLVMVPELSWGDIGRPSELVSQGEQVRVKVLSTPADSEHPFLVLV
jgi:hypothetical protein